jgi:hypothetical protein
MAIQIIDGFQVNIASPIDNRIVASGSTARNAIPYKYHGLRVFDISDNIPYVWNGASWISENASGIVGSGTLYYFPTFTSSNVISNSFLYQYMELLKLLMMVMETGWFRLIQNMDKFLLRVVFLDRVLILLT